MTMFITTGIILLEVCLVLGLALHILLRRTGSTEARLPWLLLVILLPYAGAIALLLAVTAVNDVVLSYFRAFRLMLTHSALALGHNTVEILAIAIAVWHHPDLQLVLLAMVAASRPPAAQTARPARATRSASCQL